MAPLILRDPAAAFRTSRPGIMIFRAAATTIGMTLAFYSYQALPLADANALWFTRALWIVPLAAFVLGRPPSHHGDAHRLRGRALDTAAFGEGGGNLVGALAALGAAFMFAMTITAMKIAFERLSVS